MVTSRIPLAPMGVLAPVSAHAGPSAQPPIGTRGNFSARVSAESLSISHNPSEVISEVSEVYVDFYHGPSPKDGPWSTDGN